MIARPSRPSVRFTAFEKPAITNVTNVMYSTVPSGNITLFKYGISSACSMSGLSAVK